MNAILRQPDTGPKKSIENPEFCAFARRILRAYGRRVAEGDIEGLRELVSLSAHLDNVIEEAVTGLRYEGYSWADIGARLSISKQAAQKRWGGRMIQLADAEMGEGVRP